MKRFRQWINDVAYRVYCATREDVPVSESVLKIKIEAEGTEIVSKLLTDADKLCETLSRARYLKDTLV